MIAAYLFVAAGVGLAAAGALLCGIPWLLFPLGALSVLFGLLHDFDVRGDG